MSLQKWKNSLSCVEFDALSIDALGNKLICTFYVKLEIISAKTEFFHMVFRKNDILNIISIPFYNYYEPQSLLTKHM